MCCRCDVLKEKLKKLMDLSNKRRTRLEDAVESHQVCYEHCYDL